MDAEDLDFSEGAEIPWLKEMVADDLLGLFSDDPDEVRRTAREIVDRAQDDRSVLESLITALQTAIEHQNDDTQASLWIALILGEIDDPAAFRVLFLGLGGEDENLQEAARDALLKMGAPAVMALMDEMEEEPGAEFVDAGYRLLSHVGSLKDRDLRERTMDFLAERVERELAKPGDSCRIESLFHASALLGDHRMIPRMDQALRSHFKGKNAAILDAREMLSENTAGEPLVHEIPPWIEEHRWLFDEDLESARVRRGRRPPEGEEPLAQDPAGVGGDDRRLANLYWGLGGSPRAEGGNPPDARSFLANPGEPADRDGPQEDEEWSEDGNELPEDPDETDPEAEEQDEDADDEAEDEEAR